MRSLSPPLMWFRAVLAACLVLAAAAQAPAQDEGGGPLRIDAEVIVPAAAERVWETWTTTEGLRSFFASHSRIELRVGGPFEIMFSLEPPEGQRGSEGCHVLSYLPGEMLSFSWNAPPKFANARAERTIVVVRMEPMGPQRTRVRLTHHGFSERIAERPEHAQEWRDVHAYFSNAWPYVLDNLRRRFEPAATEAATPEPPQFICNLRVVRPGLLTDGPTPEETEILGAHFEYLKDLSERGVVLLAGRTSGPPEDTFGIVIFRAADAAAAQAIMRGDPAVAGGVMTARVLPYRVAVLAPEVGTFRP